MTRVLIAAMTLSLVAGCASMPRSEIYSAACAGADVTTTAIGLSSGFSEGNSLYPDDDLAVVTGVAVAAGVHLLMRHLDAPSPAWLGYGSVRCGAAAYNALMISGD